MAQPFFTETRCDFHLEGVEESDHPPQSGTDKVRRVLGTGFAMASFMLIALLLAIVVFPVIRILPGTDETKGRRIRRIICRSFAAFLRSCTALGLIRPLRVIGLENVVQSKPCIIVANHPTLFDIVILGSLIRDFNCVVKNKLVSHLFLGGCVKAAEFVTNDRPQEIVRRCMDGFNRSQPLIIFPEGTRSPKDGLGAFTRGAAHLALRSEIPVISAILECDPPAFMKHQKWYSVPTRPIQFTVRFSKPFTCSPEVHSSSCLSTQARKLTRQMEDFFHEQLEEKWAQKTKPIGPRF